MRQRRPNEHLLERIISYKDAPSSWERVLDNTGAPGIDGITAPPPDLTFTHCGNITHLPAICSEKR